MAFNFILQKKGLPRKSVCYDTTSLTRKDQMIQEIQLHNVVAFLVSFRFQPTFFLNNVQTQYNPQYTAKPC